MLRLKVRALTSYRAGNLRSDEGDEMGRVEIGAMVKAYQEFSLSSLELYFSTMTNVSHSHKMFHVFIHFATK